MFEVKGEEEKEVSGVNREGSEKTDFQLYNKSGIESGNLKYRAHSAVSFLIGSGC